MCLPALPLADRALGHWGIGAGWCKECQRLIPLTRNGTPLQDIPALYAGLYRQLAPGGIAVTITRPQTVDYPLFQRAREVSAAGQRERERVWSGKVPRRCNQLRLGCCRLLRALLPDQLACRSPCQLLPLRCRTHTDLAGAPATPLCLYGFHAGSRVRGGGAMCPVGRQGGLAGCAVYTVRLPCPASLPS